VETYTTYNGGLCEGSYVCMRENTWFVYVVEDRIMNENGK